MNIHRFGSLESTNRYCEALDLNQVEDFTCYWALEQTAGIGQRGNRWESAAGECLTFSLVLHPTFLPANRQFGLTQMLSLAVADLLEATLRAEVRIKWPNDLYVGGRKICGMLVSNRLSTQTFKQSNNPAITSSICGIGLNVNQPGFGPDLPQATSMRMVDGEHRELEAVLHRLLEAIRVRYAQLREGSDLEPPYLERLLNLGVEARYIYKGEPLRATITGVDPYGRLLLTAVDGRRLCCAMKEIALG